MPDRAFWASDEGDVTLYLGDCLEAMRELPANSVDACVTDPPYGLEFMGQDWDAPWKHGFGATGYLDGKRMPRPNFGSTRNPVCLGCHKHQRGTDRCACDDPQYDERPADSNVAFQLWCQQWAAECLRLLKPGSHLVAFGGTRTWHRLACAIEDAGFEIRDSIDWIYAQGFPKSVNVGDGRGTALKPAHEPIVLARKPLAGTVADNVAEHGTGALNIDACRVATSDSLSGGAATKGSASRANGWNRPWKNDPEAVAAHAERVAANVAKAEDLGRWPANIVLTHAPDCRPIGTVLVRSDGHHPAARGPGGLSTSGHAGQAGLDERSAGVETVEAWECVPGCPVADLDAQSGQRPAGGSIVDPPASYLGGNGIYGAGPNRTAFAGYADNGGASRFFSIFKYEPKAGPDERPRLPDGTTHPTVKPVELMRWLVRLITPPGGLVLDPFAGSGTTAEACVIDGYRCVLIEKDPKFVELIQARLTKPIQIDLFGGAA